MKFKIKTEATISDLELLSILKAEIPYVPDLVRFILDLVDDDEDVIAQLLEEWSGYK